MTPPSLLLDLAVLYRALTFGADAELDPREVEAMRKRLQTWMPGEDPARVDHVLREAALFDVGLAMLGDVLGRICGGLDETDRVRVLDDLRQLASADGRVTRGEEDVLALAERVLGP